MLQRVEVSEISRVESPEISVVIPVYRSEKILPLLMEKLTASLNDISHEVILVHDCGPDNSWAVIRELTRPYPTLRGINLRQNVGQHSAIMAGLNYARGEVIITMDDDLQHSPDDISSLCQKIREGYDVCYADFTSRQHATWKVLGSRVNDQLAQILLNKPKGLYLSPFKAMARSVCDEVIKHEGPSIYLDGLILSITRNITSIKVPHHPRSDGQSGYSFAKSISLLLRMSTMVSAAPLRLASLAGIGLSLLGLLFALLLIVQRFTLNAMPVGWSSIVVVSLILGGVQLLALGIIGEYIGRIFLMVNKRPQFVVAATVSAEQNDASA